MTNKQETRALIATIGIGIVGGVGMIALCATLFWKNYADPSILTALISVTGTAIGTLATLSRVTMPGEDKKNGDKS